VPGRLDEFLTTRGETAEFLTSVEQSTYATSGRSERCTKKSKSRNVAADRAAISGSHAF
jgi:hypothetical protein